MDNKIKETYIANVMADVSSDYLILQRVHLEKIAVLSKVFEQMVADLNDLAEEMRELGVDVSLYTDGEEQSIEYTINFVYANS